MDSDSASEKVEMPENTPSKPSGEHAGKTRAEEIGTQAYSKAREATGHAIDAIKILLTDPMGGQGKALAVLGEPKAFSSGIVFLIIFIICEYMLISPLIELLTQGTGGSLNIIIFCSIPAIALLATTFTAAKLFGRDSTLKASVFTSGVVLLPTAVVCLVARFVGAGNIELIILSMAFAQCMIILLLNAGLMDVHKFTTRMAFIGTPLVILMTLYISKVLFVSLFSHSIDLKDIMRSIVENSRHR